MDIAVRPSGAKARIVMMMGNLLAGTKRATRRAFPGHPSPAPAGFVASRPTPLHRDGPRHEPGRPLIDNLANSSVLKLYYRSTSPDSMKVCIALNYKNIPFERVLVDSQDRSELIQVSGQSQAPVLCHKGTVVVESGTILRYLEANFPDTPPLFSSDRGTMMEIERWENLARVDLKRCVRILLGNFLSASPDMEELESAARQFHEITRTLEERLERSPWLVEERFTAADVITGPAICYGMLLPSFSTLRSLGESIADRFKLGVERAKTEEWMLRVMAYDR
jgi:glutathione S-transferase